MAEFVETNRGEKALHYEGYIYAKIRDGLQRNTFWRCKKCKSGCNGRARSEGSIFLVRRTQPSSRPGCYQERSGCVSDEEKGKRGNSLNS